jgi:hypothetical protein
MNQSSGPKLDHLKRLCAEHGIIQFSRGDEPDLESGFCLDDNVRLLVACVDLMNAGHETAFALRAGDDVLAFIEQASASAPNYHNMMDQFGRFTDRFASPESIGRLIRALGLVLRDSRHEPWRLRARRELQRATVAAAALSTEHARAFAVLGFAAAVEGGATGYLAPLRAGAEAMLFELGRNAGDGWYFPINELSYDVARIPEALLRAGEVLGDPELRHHGKLVLEFVASVVQPRERFEPIGAPQWYVRGGTRPYYAQQPLEALAMMEAWIAAQEPQRALVAYEWFLGNNLDDIAVADLTSGGCRDGINTPGALNENMGAESTLAYVQAALNSRVLRKAGEIVA